ncbi:hypothetical protein DW712_17565 [Bacteroides intestinalis]|uniref:Fimbrillin family protein n=1 Tax=Bacteroides intestinalis TaxID=329854 RepID=A0A414L4N4_9BACE|nr:fimbrillin family protein [Bacteroides intestinalis]RHE89525.1 hypothetical protein DW712_17565 [Bacteroides intestinalis]
MKTKLSLALLTMLIAAGCSESDQSNLPDSPVNAVPIRIGQSVSAVSRAVAENGTSVTATILRCDGDTSSDWSGFTKVDKNVINDSKQLTDRASVSAASFVVGTTQEISLNQELYYHTDGTTNSFVAGISPAGQVANAGTAVAFSQKDGTQDVMYASAISVGKGDSPAVSRNLTFEHKTTQLNFEIKLEKVSGGGEWNGKRVALKSIAMKEVAVPAAVDAADGTVTWSSAATLAVPGIAETVIAETATAAGSPIMIKAGDKVVVDVAIVVGGDTKVFNNVPVMNGDSHLTTVTGKSHKITLTMKEPATADDAVKITTTATVTPWVVGDSGTAEL